MTAPSPRPSLTAHIGNEDLRAAVHRRAPDSAYRDRSLDPDWMTPIEPGRELYAPVMPGQVALVPLQTLVGGLAAPALHPSGSDPRLERLSERATRLMLSGQDSLVARVLVSYTHTAMTADGTREPIMLSRSAVLVDCPELDDEPVWLCSFEAGAQARAEAAPDLVAYGPPVRHDQDPTRPL